MKKFSLFSIFLFSCNLLLMGAVENITVSDNIIFTPDVAVSEVPEPEDYGLNLDDFIISDSNTRLERDTENKLSIGLLTTILRKPYYGAESDFSIYPLIEGKYNNFFIKPTTTDTISGYVGGYNFYSDNQFVVSAITEYQLSKLASKDLASPYNKFIESKDSEFYFGFSGKFIPDSNPDFMLAAEITKNFLNSGGGKVKIYGERYIGLTPDLQIIPAISYTFLDKNYVDYFYGVPSNSSNVTSFKNASGSKFGIHLDLTYSLGDNISFKSISSVEILSNDIAQSSLIANNINMNIGLGLMYHF